MNDDGRRRRRRTDNGACLYYKLTYEPKGSGELKSGMTSGFRAINYLPSALGDETEFSGTQNIKLKINIIELSIFLIL